MPNFHYLGKNGFPNADNVNVYDYQNGIDYSRYDYSQMSIQVCSVPWDQGEAHMGQRVLSGIGNVVHFGSAERRDAWFDAIPDTECFRWETKFKELHSDLTLKVPLPFDIASNYNYVRVTYNLFANDDSPLQYESGDGVRKWFYFIRDARFIAPNTTELLLLDDAWQTWIYSLDISSMILERGHAPMFATRADAYLADPIGSCADLLSEDINYGELQKVTKTQATSLNSENMKAVIVCSSNPAGEWGTKVSNNWKVPASAFYDGAGVPNMYAFAIDVSQLDTFLASVDASSPQFKQSVQCVFFCAAELLELGSAYTFCGTACYPVQGGANPISKTILTRSKADWGYGSKYQDLAKLYTYPYSAFEITDEKGNTELVRIEDTAQALAMDVAANIVFPYINIVGSIRGIGGNASSTLSFQNITAKTFTGAGRWYEHLRTWEVPTFAVVLDAAIEYDYSSHFDRIQADSDRATSRANTVNVANASYTASATQANASYDSTSTLAYASETMADNSADNVVDNASAQTTANSTVTSEGNSAASADASLANSLAQAIQAWDAGMSRETVNNEANKENATAAVGAAGGVINSAAGGAVSGFLTAGPAGAAAGAIGGLVSGGIGAATSLATNAIAVSAMSTQAEAVISNSQSKLEETQQSNIDRTTRANTGRTSQTNAQNVAITTSAANTSSTMKENAATDRAARIGAANTVRNAAISAAGTARDAQLAAADLTYANEGSRIQNGIRQAALRAPSIFGSVSNAGLSTTRPMALFVSIVTESSFAIQRAGDEFLRYGYYLDKQWPFDGNWTIGRHFTFWKLRDYWSTNQIPDRFADQLRMLLYGGVTVWKSPDDIGRVSIYDNGI
jgi:hypothetical protein|nr:MAG TPA: Major tail protein [Bacteriophage sp.]